MKKISLEEHKKYGEELFELRNRIGKIVLPLRNAYPRADAKAEALLSAMEGFRTIMDDIVCGEYPQLPDMERVYYPRKPGQ
ncbi:hypothetical protein OOT00_14805 [Desulfobotulus sp. H1]|uniref:Uncharacterized protein n=1 Tax=Desulfobotulus pelophilus TaxID=2823377 RepID=A0ABT3NCQ8_9BACT|nr:hypothetical protein [Desulfobotulus pelophilus]MCW7755255.1 hypothetical protein [Desulfobotulus pelophilus]